MISESIPLLTLLDLVFIAVAVAGAGFLRRIRRRPRLAELTWGPMAIAAGVGAIGLFYFVD